MYITLNNLFIKKVEKPAVLQKQSHDNKFLATLTAFLEFPIHVKSRITVFAFSQSRLLIVLRNIYKDIYLEHAGQRESRL